MTEIERDRHLERILDAAIPDRRERATRYDPQPVVVRILEIEDALLVKATAAPRDRAALLQAIRAELEDDTPVRFMP